MFSFETIAKFKEFIGKEQNVKYQKTFAENEVAYQLKSIDILQSDKAKQVFNTLNKNKVTGDNFWNKIQKDLQIPKEQVNLLKESEGNTIEEKLTSFVANYSYTIEINTAKGGNKDLTIKETEFKGEKRFSIVDAHTTMPLKSFKTEKEAND